MREEMEKSVDTILTCDGCKKDLICLVCKTSKSLISKLNDKLQEQRNTIMSRDDDVCSSDDEKEDMDFADKALKKMKMSTATEDESTDAESVKELQMYVIDKEKALQKLGEIPLIDMKIKEGRRKRKKKSPGPTLQHQQLQINHTMLLLLEPTIANPTLQHQQLQINHTMLLLLEPGSNFTTSTIANKSYYVIIV
ncbi:unnamed protein product [Mytilus coruscus]|uniref:Uncharacterized protein n=1 Tax=Mytilus coruscus TaxID=42192 RepID=A0A6J8CWI2_MYTCO|nr:unnamed protein product [Mytilus coruscus]